MAGSIADPRLEAAAEQLRSGRWYPSEYEGSRSAERWCRRAAAALIESIDAADGAAGVRRVSVVPATGVPHIARKSDLTGEPSQALCGAPVRSAVEQEGPVCGLCVLIYERAEALGWLPPLADPPVRGVS